MADLAQRFRDLGAADLPHATKLQLAQQLSCMFLGINFHTASEDDPKAASTSQKHVTIASAADVHSMPAAVRAHYVRLLLNWTQSALVKAKITAQTDSSVSEQLQHQEVTWQLLAVLLMSPEMPAAAALSVSLVAAAAAACKACSPEQAHSKAGQELAVALQQTLLVLNTKFGQSFRPSLEHSTALVGSMLMHAKYDVTSDTPVASSAAWQAAAAQAVLQLTDIAASHPNQKKVFTAIVTKPMLLLIAQAIWPEEASQKVTVDTAELHQASDSSSIGHMTDSRTRLHSERRLAVLLKQLMHKVIFHPSSIEGMLELGASFGSQLDAGAQKKSDNAPRSYHFQLLQVINDTVSDAPPTSAATYAFTHLLTWLVSSFAAAVKQLRANNSATEGSAHIGPTAATVSIPITTDFAFAAVMLQPLLSRMQQPANPICTTLSESKVSQPGAAAAAPPPSPAAQQPASAGKRKKKGRVSASQLHTGNPAVVPLHRSVAAKGAAMLITQMAVKNIYRPTEDTTGSHRQLLAALADAALQQAASLIAAIPNPGPGEAKQEGANAVCDVLSAVLRVEHRAVQPHLADIWHLLWQAAADQNGQHVAVEVALGLVKAYAELRQLQFLLQSLLSSLASHKPATAQDIVCNTSFVMTLHQAVQSMPSGQAVPMLTFVAEGIPILTAAPDDSPAQAAIGQMLGTCLAAIRIELISAPNLAQAASTLLTNSLQPALAPLLQSIAGTAQHQLNLGSQCVKQDSAQDGSKGVEPAQHTQREATDSQSAGIAGAKQQLLGCLLRLYHCTVGIHGQCAAMQPQIEPLPGQATGMPHHDSSLQAAQQGATGPPTDYFAALWPVHSQIVNMPLPIMWASADRSSTSSSSILYAAIASCALQRLDTLHERLLHLRYTCTLSNASSNATPDLSSMAEQQTTTAAGSEAATAMTPKAGVLLPTDTHALDGNLPVGPLRASEQHCKGLPTAGTASLDHQEADILHELQQLADQVLQHACSSAKQHTATPQVTKHPHTLQTPTPQSLQTFKTGQAIIDVQEARWQQAAERLSLLACYASASALQAFMHNMLETAFCTGSTSRSTSPSQTHGQAPCEQAAAPGQASDPSAQARPSLAPGPNAQAAALLIQPRVWQQETVQQAWLQALRVLLERSCKEGATPPSTEPATTTKRRKKGPAQPTEQPGTASTPSRSAVASLSGDVHSVKKLLTDACASVHAYLQTAQASDSTLAPTAIHSQTDTPKQHVEGSKKRKSASMQTASISIDPQTGASAQQQLPVLSNMAALLHHAAEISAQHESDAIACPLAILMLQCQAWLVQQLLSNLQHSTPKSSSVPTTERRTAAHTHLSQASICIVQSLVSAQSTLAHCLQAQADTVAASLSPVAETLWQWLIATCQLTKHLAGHNGLSHISATKQVPAQPAAIPSQSDSASDQQKPVIASPKGDNDPQAASDPTTQAQQLAPAKVTGRQNVSADMLAHVASCVTSLGSYSLGVRQAVVCSEGSTAKSMPVVCGGFLRFVANVAEAMQGGTDADIMTVMAEACLATAVQAATALAPAKRKKALAAVIAGPEHTLKHCIQPEHLQAVSSHLEPAVQVCLQKQLSILTRPLDFQQQQQQPQPQEVTDASAVSDRSPVKPAVLCALFGCHGRLLQLQHKASSGSSAQQSKHVVSRDALSQGAAAHINAADHMHGDHAAIAEQLQDDAQHNVSQDVAMSDDSDASSRDSDDSDSSKSSAMQEKQDARDDTDSVVEHAGKGVQLSRLTDSLRAMLGKPWQFQSQSNCNSCNRWDLTVRSGQHLVGCLHAAANALSVVPVQPEGLWTDLLAMHLHVLGSVMPVLQAPEPLRHAGSAPMGMPTLVAPADPQQACLVMLRRGLLLSLRDLLQGSSREQTHELLQGLCAGLLQAADSPRALPFLEGMLVSLETPRSQRGLQALARHSKPLTTTILHFLSRTSHERTRPFDTLSSKTSVAQHPHHQHTAAKVALAENAAAASNISLLTVLNSLSSQAAARASQASEDSFAQTDTQWQQALELQQLQQRLVAAQAASISTAHRCLESMLAREAVFNLPAAVVAEAMNSPAAVLSAAGQPGLSPNPAQMTSLLPNSTPNVFSLTGAMLQQQQQQVWTMSHEIHGRQMASNGIGRAATWDVEEGAGVYVGCCSLLLAGLRHHAKAVRRCMALVAASTRALLQMLVHWAASGSSEMEGRGKHEVAGSGKHEALLMLCASELAQLYTIIAADKDALGKYCMYMLADYVTWAAAPPLDNSTASDMAAGPVREAFTGAPAGALQQGALALYGACSPAELQHLHAKLGNTSGGLQRAALAELRRKYQSDYKYTGKV